MEKLCYTLIAAAAGGILGYQLRLPAGALIGSMIGVGIYNISTNQAYMPHYFRIGAQIVAGAMIGLRINRETIHGFKELIGPALIIIVAVLAVCIIAGLLMHKFTGLDLTTALFASAPGGMTEMSLAADSLGGNTPQVALLQLVRLLSTLIILPFVAKLIIGVGK